MLRLGSIKKIILALGISSFILPINAANLAPSSNDQYSYDKYSDDYGVDYSDSDSDSDEDSEEFQSDDEQAYESSEPQQYYAKNDSSRYRSTASAPKRAATGKRVFIFNPKSLTWRAYDSDGSLVKAGRGSGGRGYCPDVKRSCKTPSGTFRVYSKVGPNFRSSRFPLPYGGAPMPYAMFFYRGFAIHGSYDVPNYNASHGCIRVLPKDARWLNNNFLNYGSTVIVHPY